MVYRVHTRQAQLALFKGDELPKTLIRPDSMKKEPNYQAFRRMVRKMPIWNISSKSKT